MTSDGQHFDSQVQSNATMVSDPQQLLKHEQQLLYSTGHMTGIWLDQALLDWTWLDT